ncbi:MAG: hypothetical protein PHC50_03430 [Candidatus Cloacimonetes bacterium]|nr:hypothetical protein [Candidatus Cloacimonadota bacterium]
MNDLATKIFFTLFTLYAGVLSWLLKTAWSDIQNLKKDIRKIKEDIDRDLDRRFDLFLSQLDAKLDSWWAKIEVNLMNDGRIPPKSRPKKGE